MTIKASLTFKKSIAMKTPMTYPICQVMSVSCQASIPAIRLVSLMTRARM